MSLAVAVAIDNIGVNDPEVQMTICMWIGRIVFWGF